MADQLLVDYAPIITEAGVTKVYCDSIEVTSPVSTNDEPVLTKKIVEAIIAEFADIQGANGFISIAQKHGATFRQVKKIYAEFMLTKNPPLKVVEVAEITK